MGPPYVSERILSMSTAPSQRAHAPRGPYAGVSLLYRSNENQLDCYGVTWVWRANFSVFEEAHESSASECAVGVVRETRAPNRAAKVCRHCSPVYF